MAFARVIELMRHITLRGLDSEGASPDQILVGKSELLPLPNIAKLKQQEESSYLEVPQTGAKISMRDAKQLIEQFCLELAGVKVKLQKPAKVEESENHLELKPNYKCVEGQKEGVKFFFAQLYMPQTCMDILRKVNPKYAYIKKKDAENSVALLAVRKLRERGYLDDSLFPCIQGESYSRVNILNTSQSSDLNSSLATKLQRGALTSKQITTDGQGNILDLSQPRKKKQITDEQKS